MRDSGDLTCVARSQTIARIGPETCAKFGQDDGSNYSLMEARSGAFIYCRHAASDHALEASSSIEVVRTNRYSAECIRQEKKPQDSG